MRWSTDHDHQSVRDCNDKFRLTHLHVSLTESLLSSIYTYCTTLCNHRWVIQQVMVSEARPCSPATLCIMRSSKSQDMRWLIPLMFMQSTLLLTVYNWVSDRYLEVELAIYGVHQVPLNIVWVDMWKPKHALSIVVRTNGWGESGYGERCNSSSLYGNMKCISYCLIIDIVNVITSNLNETYLGLTECPYLFSIELTVAGCCILLWRLLF